MKESGFWEYTRIAAPVQSASLWLDGYACFGWQPDANLPVRPRGRRVTLYLKRDRKLVNRTELTRLQHHFDACMGQISQLEASCGRRAGLWAAAAALIGTAFMAGAVFAVTHQPPRWLLMTLLAVPGFTGWIVPAPLHSRVRRRQEQRVRPLIEAEYETIGQLCEKGRALL